MPLSAQLGFETCGRASKLPCVPLLELRLAVGPQMFTSRKMPDLQEVGSGCGGKGGWVGRSGEREGGGCSLDVVSLSLTLFG